MTSNQKQTLQSKLLWGAFLFIIIGVVLWLPVVFLYAEITGFMYLRDSADWDMTKAKIEVASVGVERKNNPSGRQSTYTKVKFLYRYWVKDKLYSSERYAFGFKNHNKNAISNYKVGDSIQVYYQPEDPSIATIKKEYEFGFWTPFLYILCIALIVFAGFLLFGVFLQ